MTDAEKFVREQLPECAIGGPMKNGKAHPQGGYMVFATTWCSGPYASGSTAIEAWAAAANRLLAEAKRG